VESLHTTAAELAVLAMQFTPAEEAEEHQISAELPTLWETAWSSQAEAAAVTETRLPEVEMAATQTVPPEQQERVRMFPAAVARLQVEALLDQAAAIAESWGLAVTAPGAAAGAPVTTEAVALSEPAAAEAPATPAVQS
jgi:hypothetical protein